MATVLIVDDDPAILQLLCDLAEEMGHTVLSASNGIAGLELARTQQPQLILSDVMMPALDGYGLVHALRTDPALAGTAVFLMSAAFAHSRRMRETEATGFIAKPFDLAQLEQLLRSLPM